MQRALSGVTGILLGTVHSTREVGTEMSSAAGDVINSLIMKITPSLSVICLIMFVMYKVDKRLHTRRQCKTVIDMYCLILQRRIGSFVPQTQRP